jgi:hypothetical protein
MLSHLDVAPFPELFGEILKERQIFLRTTLHILSATASQNGITIPEHISKETGVIKPKVDWSPEEENDS